MAALRVKAPFSRPAVGRVFSLTSGHGHASAVVSHVPGLTTLSTPTPFRSTREFRSRHLLALPVRANPSGDINKSSDSKRDLYICFAACLVIKDKAVTLVKAKALISEKYITVAMALLALLKAVYQSLKLAKEIRELVKCYRSSKKTDTK